MSDNDNDLPPLPKGSKELPTRGKFVKWEKRGQQISGTILRMELSQKYKGEGYIVEIATDDGEHIAVSAPLQLQRTIENYQLIGKRVVIQYTGDTPMENSDKAMKEFRVATM